MLPSLSSMVNRGRWSLTEVEGTDRVDYVNPFSVGQWIRWTTFQHVKEGQVVVSEGPSIVVEWLGGECQVFPIVEAYVGPYRAVDDRMEVVQRPKNALRIEREVKRGQMSVARAAAVLGIDQKRVRARLRAGTLKGVQSGGKWIAVELEA